MILKQRWFWIVVITLVMIAVATLMVFFADLQPAEALKFFGGPAIALPVGYILGKTEKGGVQ